MPNPSAPTPTAASARLLLALSCAVAGLAACGGGGSSAADAAVAAPPPAASAPPPAPAPSPAPSPARAGELTLLLGDVGGEGNLDGAAALARFQSPGQVIVDAAGSLYVLDAEDRLLRRVDLQGQVSTVLSGDVGAGLLLDARGKVLLAGGSHAMEIGESGRTSPVFPYPVGIYFTLVVDAEGRMFGVQDTNDSYFNYIYIKSSRVVRVMPGADGGTRLIPVPGAVGAEGLPGRRGDQLSLARDPKGRIHLAWKKTGTNQLQLFRLSDDAQSFQPASPVVGIPGIAAQEAGGSPGVATLPITHAVDADGNAYLHYAMQWDGAGSALVKVSPAGDVVTIGSPTEPGGADGPLATARFGEVRGIAVDAEGRVYVSDALNHNIRRIDPKKGEVSTFAGPPAGRSLMGLVAPAVLGGGRLQGQLEELVVSPSGQDVRLLFTRIRSPAGAPWEQEPAWAHAYGTQLFRAKGDGTSFDAVALPGGSDAYGFGGRYRVGRDRAGDFHFRGGKYSPTGQPLPLPVQQFLSNLDTGEPLRPGAMAVDRHGMVTSAYGQALVQWQPGSDGLAEFKFQAGALNTWSAPAPVQDGVKLGAGLAGVMGMAADAAGNVYLADSLSPYPEERPHHALVRKLAPDGTVTTLAGSPGRIGSADGKGAAASFAYASDVALDSAGNVYVADAGNYAVRKVAPDGTVSTVVGQPGRRGIRLGALPATLGRPTAIEIDGDDVLYIATPGAVLKVKLPK